jgi:hypothetical protein
MGRKHSMNPISCGQACDIPRQMFVSRTLWIDLIFGLYSGVVPSPARGVRAPRRGAEQS